MSFVVLFTYSTEKNQVYTIYVHMKVEGQDCWNYPTGVIFFLWAAENARFLCYFWQVAICVLNIQMYCVQVLCYIPFPTTIWKIEIRKSCICLMFGVKSDIRTYITCIIMQDWFMQNFPCKCFKNSLKAAAVYMRTARTLIKFWKHRMIIDNANVLTGGEKLKQIQNEPITSNHYYTVIM